VLKWGFTKRCAVCGSGHLFHRWVNMAPSCPHCGHRFYREPGHWCGSWFLNICMAQMMVVLFLITAAAVEWPEPPGISVIVGGLLVTFACTFFFFPFSRTIWCAIDLAMKPLDFTDDVAPGFELEAEIKAFLAEEAGKQAGESPG
jgi:uncharacterized protein (DUF983 family)